ncbi:hypothetical protein FA09DRAFT_327222 [Tilletiopsis washingtonensis]|uniref:Uncharacterized protein n=1 Tax=Tilletiopsis washingtonensis TaxID=58919 RepID=A0A316ZIC0_9BASI|nr:hypothetical protein FA09DRAFT_327222 [Tilletiopsis washingtonensis]PWO01272.1 hypothetical protein FA09DRAFT_327222 [Tilletiopsis washingtonensis]
MLPTPLLQRRVISARGFCPYFSKLRMGFCSLPEALLQQGRVRDSQAMLTASFAIRAPNLLGLEANQRVLLFSSRMVADASKSDSARALSRFSKLPDDREQSDCPGQEETDSGDARTRPSFPALELFRDNLRKIQRWNRSPGGSKADGEEEGHSTDDDGRSGKGLGGS